MTDKIKGKPGPKPETVRRSDAQKPGPKPSGNAKSYADRCRAYRERKKVKIVENKC